MAPLTTFLKALEEQGLEGVEPSLDRNALVWKAFKRAKELGRAPAELAGEMAEKVKGLPFVERAEVVGGFLNIYLSEKALWDLSLEEGRREERVMVEFPSVNPNKPWHIGHLRNALLGESISRIAAFLGYDVVKIDYIDDLGLQIAESYWYWLKAGKDEPCGEKFDHCIGKQYVKAHAMAEEHQEEIREMLRKLEEGDEGARAFAERVVKAQYETAFRYGIYHHYLVFESDIARKLSEGYRWLKEQGAVVYVEEGKNKGCWVVRMPEGFMGLKDNEKVLIRSDGTATYTGKDVIFHLWKAGKLGEFLYKPFIEQPNGEVAWASSREGEEKRVAGADILINVIGKEQEFPQAVVREVLKKLNVDVELIHLSYAAVRLKEGRFSGRKGTWIGYTADELFEEGLRRLEVMGRGRSESIVRAAIAYAFLKIHRLKEVVFDWDKALSFEGDSGPYLLYSYVRALSVLRKAREKGLSPQPGPLGEDERALLFSLALTQLKVEESFRSLSPHPLAHHLSYVSQLFHRFYDKNPILKAESPVRESRLAVVEKYVRLMEKAMPLILIEPVERM